MLCHACMQHGKYESDDNVVIIITTGFSLSAPLGILHVCPGDQLLLTCVTNASFLEWNITAQNYIGLRLVSSEGIPNIQPLTVNYTTFGFTRESSEPLNVTLSIINATVDLRIVCIEYLESSQQVATVDIDVIYLSRPKLIMTELSFAVHNVSMTIILDGNLIMDDVSGLSYGISFTVVPYSTVIATNESASLILSYNTLYILTVFGTLDFCGYNGEAATVSLFYGKAFCYI